MYQFGAYQAWSIRSRTFIFFFNDTATTEIYTLSLHDALPICLRLAERVLPDEGEALGNPVEPRLGADRKSTRLNSSHGYISYAVFCLKKKKRSVHLRHDYSGKGVGSRPPAQSELDQAHSFNEG